MSADHDDAARRRASADATQPFHSDTVRAEARRWYRQPGFVAPASAIVVVLTAVWTYHAVRSSLSTLLENQLSGLRNAVEEAGELWLASEKDAVSIWAEDADVRRLTVALAAAAAPATDRRRALQQSVELAPLHAALGAASDSGDLDGYLVVSRDGVILASTRPQALGEHIAPALLARLGAALEGDVLVTHPYRGSITAAGPAIAKPLMFAATGIQDEADQVVAMLVFRIHPEQEFSRIFRVAEFGDSGHAFAFDQSGTLLSRDENVAALQSLGLVPEVGYRETILTLSLRDPGGNLTEGYVAQSPVAARPLTRMAASAVGGESGVAPDPYRDVRGVPVVGAWRWLDAYELGIAVEMDAAEAYAALRPLMSVFAVLTGLLLLAAGMVVAYSVNARRLRRRMVEVQRVGQYTLVDKIGEGGMAVVHSARHAMLRRPTAVKLLKPDAMSEESLARFEREVQLTSELKHPNTIEIYDFGRAPDGRFYYAMEYLDGISLGELIETMGRVTPVRAVHILIQICASLVEAHGSGLVHRDIKPANIMICYRRAQGDVVKVLDFGLVKDLGDAGALTVADVVAGTPQYIAPERLRDPRHVDPRVDIYSVGAVAFNLITAEELFPGSSSGEAVFHALNSDPRRAGSIAPDIPQALDDLLADCLAREPEARPADAHALLDRLRGIFPGTDWTERDAEHWWVEHAAQIEQVIAARLPS